MLLSRGIEWLRRRTWLLGAPIAGAQDPGLGDSLGLKVYRTGDLNCDGIINFDDINAFVLAVTQWGRYLQQHVDCEIMSADINGHGFVTFEDINPFVALLSGE